MLLLSIIFVISSCLFSNPISMTVQQLLTGVLSMNGCCDYNEKFVLECFWIKISSMWPLLLPLKRENLECTNDKTAFQELYISVLEVM